MCCGATIFVTLKLYNLKAKKAEGAKGGVGCGFLELSLQDPTLPLCHLKMMMPTFPP